MYLPLDTNGNSSVIKQDIFLVEVETKHADTILEFLKSLLQENVEKWPITSKLQVIPVCTFSPIDENIIGKYAMKQNMYSISLECFTLRGYYKIDEKT